MIITIIQYIITVIPGFSISIQVASFFQVISYFHNNFYHCFYDVIFHTNIYNPDYSPTQSTKICSSFFSCLVFIPIPLLIGFYPKTIEHYVKENSVVDNTLNSLSPYYGSLRKRSINKRSLEHSINLLVSSKRTYTHLFQMTLSLRERVISVSFLTLVFPQ